MFIGRDRHGPLAACFLLLFLTPAFGEEWSTTNLRTLSDSVGYDVFENDESANDDGPLIPEPMVFDLVRPLGAKRGELEFNTLVLFPLNRRRVPAGSEVDDPLGLVPRSPDARGVEWAPEIEYALWDGFALEFELPFEDSVLEAYKFAAQWTFGTAFENRFIHGSQIIVQYDRDPVIWTPTFLYLAGVRFDERWSLLGMFGFRNQLGKQNDIGNRAELLLNTTLFYDLTDRLILGIETNYASAMSGVSTLYVAPQAHYEITDNIVFQTGFGFGFAPDFILPEYVFRLIFEF